jgi:hypothetical protein
MNTTTFPGTHTLPAEHTVRLPMVAGVLTVLAGEVWLTRGAEDEFVAAGQTLRLRAGAVIEALPTGGSAVLRWQPQAAPAQRALAWVLRRFAAGFLRAAGGLGALARNAASMASRAQGCMATGDSMASSGTVK